MAGAVRLNNGATVQVRVGVLQGVGPIGPRGLQGERGLQGDEGPEGPTGPTGGIATYLGQATIGTANSITAATNTNVSFNTLVTDDIGGYTATAWTLAEAGDYDIKAWLEFTAPGGAATGRRTMYLTAGSTTVAKSACTAVAADFTDLSVSWVLRVTSSVIVRVWCRSDQANAAATSVATGGWSINRIGAGTRGATGPQGPAGPVGPAGPQGPQGDDGDASGGFSTYADLL